MTKRLEPTPATIKLLFGMSGNRCASPDCREPILAEDVVVGEVCHIHSVNATDARHRPEMTPEELRAPDNLILLCHRHHRLADRRESAYSADLLRSWKAQHEARWAAAGSTLADTAAMTLIEESATRAYEPRMWGAGERLHALLFSSNLFDWPQQPMNLALEILAGILDTEVELLYSQIRERTSREIGFALALEQQRWRLERDGSAQREAEEFQGGTMARAVRGSSLVTASLARLVALRAAAEAANVRLFKNYSHPSFQAALAGWRPDGWPDDDG